MKPHLRLLFIISFLGSFFLASSEADSCTSNLSLNVPTSFDITNLHCLSVWDAQGFILRVSAPCLNFITCLYTLIPIAPKYKSLCLNSAVCSDFCKHLELHSLNPGHKFLHSYGILSQRQHGGFKCHGGVGGIKRSQWRDKAVLSWWGHTKSGGS